MVKVPSPDPRKAAFASLRPTGRNLLQRKCACGGPPGPTGECEACRKKKLQRKFAIGTSSDPLEQEADRVADEVLASRNHTASGAPPHIRRLAGQATEQCGRTPTSVDHALASPGRPLDTALRQAMEQRFGHDFSQVRVHSDVAADQSAHDLNAHAYTVGRDIVFGAGRFAPTTHEGRRLIAHELTHVVQQRNGINRSDYRSQPLTFPIQRQTQSADLPGTVQKPTPPPLTLLKIFSENRGSFSRFTGIEFLRESHARGATNQSLQVKQGGIYWTFTFVINRTTGEFFVRQQQNGTQIVNHYRGQLIDEPSTPNLGAVSESDDSVKKPPGSEDSVPDSTPPQEPPTRKPPAKKPPTKKPPVKKPPCTPSVINVAFQWQSDRAVPVNRAMMGAQMVNIAASWQPCNTSIQIVINSPARLPAPAWFVTVMNSRAAAIQNALIRNGVPAQAFLPASINYRQPGTQNAQVLIK
jgi:hypothetical protein